MSFVIYESGQAQGGSSTTILLASQASDENDYYNGKTIEITSGTGNGQSRTITDYVYTAPVPPLPAYHTATVASWGTPPNTTSVYRLNGITLPYLPFTCRETSPSETTTKGYPGKEPLRVIIGGKGTKVLIEGYLYGYTLTLAQLVTNYIQPLRDKRWHRVDLVTPDGIYDGMYVFDDFQHTLAKDHPAAFKYKMLFGKGHIILTAF